MGGIFNNGNNMWTLARTQRLVGAQEALSRRQPGKLPASRAVQKLGPAGTGREGALPGSRPAVNGWVNAPALTYIDRLPASVPSARSMSEQKGKRSSGLNSYH